MQYLSLPIPVTRFLKRLINVVSSLTISNQYLLLQKADVGGTSGGRGEGRHTGGEQVSQWTHIKTSGLYQPQLSMLSSTDHSLPQIDVGKHEYYEEKVARRNVRLRTKSPPTSPSPGEDRGGTQVQDQLSPIQELLLHPMLFDPVRKPRYPLVLCHGLYGFDVRGPSAFPVLQMHYWSNVLRILKKKIGAEVIVTGVPGTGSVESRAQKLHEYLQKTVRGRAVNFLAHSMGGLDCRHLISRVQPEEYAPVSLTTICTPHRGSPFMDWCTDNIGIGKPRDKLSGYYRAKSAAVPEPPPQPSNSQFSWSSLPSSFTTLLLSVIDSPAYSNLTTSYLRDVFNPATPDDPNVKYYSVAARTQNINVWHPLWLPKLVLDGVEEKEKNRESNDHERRTTSPLQYWESSDWGNDGLVSVRSAKWGEFLGTLEGVDHWEIRGAGGNVDISIPALVKNSLSEPFAWSWRDWGKFVGAWKDEEDKRRRDEGQKGSSHSPSPSKSSSTATSLSTHSKPDAEAKEGMDEVLKSSTDNLSAVFGWIFEQVPGSSSSLPSTKASSRDSAMDKERKEVARRKSKEAKDPRLKFDLEKFYVALTRKLYEDGL